MFCLNFPFDSGEGVKNKESLPTDDMTEGRTDKTDSWQTTGDKKSLI